MVVYPSVAPAAIPSENGWLWMWPCSTTPCHSTARRCSTCARSWGFKSMSSAIWPTISVVATCML